MAAKLGHVTMELLVRQKGSTAEPQVVGTIDVDLDGAVSYPPEQIPPLPAPAPLPEFIDAPTEEEASDAAAR